MNYLKKTFTVAYQSEDYSGNWEATFRPVQLQRKVLGNAWETISRHATMEDAICAIPGDGETYRAIEPDPS